MGPGVEANLLQPGDLLSSNDGQWTAVEEIHDTGEYETLYNIRVADSLDVYFKEAAKLKK